jgi:hypothetical protein
MRRTSDACDDSPVVRHRVCDDSVLTTSAAAQQPAADPPGEIDALAAKIEELDQQLRVLQRKLEIEKEQAAEK